MHNELSPAYYLTYIHNRTLERHVGTSDSVHNWCKKELGVEDSLTLTNPTETHTKQGLTS